VQAHLVPESKRIVLHVPKREADGATVSLSLVAWEPHQKGSLQVVRRGEKRLGHKQQAMANQEREKRNQEYLVPASLFRAGWASTKKIGRRFEVPDGIILVRGFELPEFSVGRPLHTPTGPGIRCSVKPRLRTPDSLNH
jgi:hypothetical protein